MKALKLLAALVLVALISCAENTNPTQVASGKSGANVVVNLGSGPVDQLPAKLVVTLTADGQEGYIDTVLIDKNEVSCKFTTLAPYKEWTVTAFTLDSKDSVVNQGTNTFRTVPNTMHDVYMELLAKYFKLQAYIAHAQQGMTRAELIIDGKYSFQAAVVPTGSGRDTIEVTGDYIPLKNEYLVSAKVYGTGNDGMEALFYQGSTTVTLPWYDDRLVVFALAAQPPLYSAAPLTVLLLPASGNTQAGRIGQPLFNEKTGHYYDVITFENSISWYDAKDRAASHTYKGLKGHLATIASAEENQFIWKYLAAQAGVSSLHIGAFQSPKTAVPSENWQWITGEPWDYTNWSPGEPNDFKEVDEYHLMFWVYSGKWNDQSATLRGYIVEYE